MKLKQRRSQVEDKIYNSQTSRPILTNNKIDTLRLHKLLQRLLTNYASAVYAVVAYPYVHRYVCHRPALYQKEWTNRAGFWHVGFFSPIPYCVIRKYGYLQIKVPPSGNLS